MNYKNLYIIFISALVWNTSCSSLVEVDMPKNQLTDDKVFADSTTAVAALSQIYARLGNGFNSVDNSFNIYVSLYADEYAYTLSSGTIRDYFLSFLPSDNSQNRNNWTYLYEPVYACNAILEQVPSSPTLSESLKALLIDEAKFLRAYAYFYLQNTYGHIPLLLQTDVNINRLAAQTDENVVYAQILQDLTEAKVGLSVAYPSANRVRANQWTAAAMLARVQLYQRNWEAAEAEATAVISSGLYSPLDGTADIFHSNSQEAILQIWTPDGFISHAAQIIPANSTTVPIYTITDALRQAFEAGDLRRDNWITTSTVANADGTSTTYYRPFKYKNRVANTSQPEYLMVLRLAEQYLIRAEARARQGNVSGAVEDLNVIRDRAGLAPLNAGISIEECLAAIMQERRVELFGEWGHRFFDLKRTGQLDAVMAYKDTWRSTASVFPIPQNELIYNPNLVQNPGYE